MATQKIKFGSSEEKFAQAEQDYGLKFINRKHYELSWIHRSCNDSTKQEIQPHYERLEFLGDSVVNMIVSNWLYHEWPNAAEGQLSKKKSILVSASVLSECAKMINLGKYLRLGVSEEKNQGRARDPLLADAFEASVGALWLDQGLEACEKWIQRLLLVRAHDILKDEKFQNYKSILLEYTQLKEHVTPTYTVLLEEGPEHIKSYTIQVEAIDVVAVGVGSSKKKAEQEASQNAVNELVARGLLVLE